MVICVMEMFDWLTNQLLWENALVLFTFHSIQTVAVYWGIIAHRSIVISLARKYKFTINIIMAPGVKLLSPIIDETNVYRKDIHQANSNCCQKCVHVRQNNPWSYFTLIYNGNIITGRQSRSMI